MLFGSARVQAFERPRRGLLFARDLGVSLLAIGLLGALLAAIQAKPAGSGHRESAVLTKFQDRSLAVAQLPKHAFAREEAAVPAADEERVRAAMIEFALSKVAPSIPEVLEPAPPPAIVQTPRPPRRPQKAAAQPRVQPVRIPAGIGQTGFTQAEWPARARERNLGRPPRDRPFLDNIARLTPSPEKIASGAQTLATGARKTVATGITGLRGGVQSVHDRAITLAGKFW